MALSQETKDNLWFGAYPAFFLLLIFALAMWCNTVQVEVRDHIAYEDSVIGARITEQLDFSYVEDSVERYKIAEQHYQTVFWNSLDTVQKAYLNKIETYQDSLAQVTPIKK